MKPIALIVAVFLFFTLFPPAPVQPSAITVTPLSVPASASAGGQLSVRFSVSGGEGFLYYQVWLETWYGGQWHYPGFPGRTFMNSRTFSVSLDVPPGSAEKVRVGLFVTDNHSNQAEWLSEEIPIE